MRPQAKPNQIGRQLDPNRRPTILYTNKRIRKDRVLFGSPGRDLVPCVLGREKRFSSSLGGLAVFKGQVEENKYIYRSCDSPFCYAGTPF